jgi:hypothetical protein
MDAVDDEVPEMQRWQVILVSIACCVFALNSFVFARYLSAEQLLVTLIMASVTLFSHIGRSAGKRKANFSVLGRSAAGIW